MIEGLRRDRPAFLASVMTAAEAEMAFRGGAGIIDCKDPASGALGALDAEAVRNIVAVIAGRVPVSATIGDLPAEADAMVSAAAAMSATGVDIVKIGFFGDQDARPGHRGAWSGKPTAHPTRRRADGGPQSGYLASSHTCG